MYLMPCDIKTCQKKNESLHVYISDSFNFHIFYIFHTDIESKLRIGINKQQIQPERVYDILWHLHSSRAVGSYVYQTWTGLHQPLHTLQGQLVGCNGK